MASKIKTHEDLEVYRLAFKAAMKIFELSKKFPIKIEQRLYPRCSTSEAEIWVFSHDTKIKDKLLSQKLENEDLEFVRACRGRFAKQLETAEFFK